MFVLAQTSDGDAFGGFVLFVVLGLLGVLFYFLPTIIAFIKKPPSIASVVVINVFLGWTFIGWVVALAMAFRDGRPQQQVIVYNQSEGGQPPPQPT